MIVYMIIAPNHLSLHSIRFGMCFSFELFFIILLEKFSVLFFLLNRFHEFEMATMILKSAKCCAGECTSPWNSWKSRSDFTFYLFRFLYSNLQRPWSNKRIRLVTFFFFKKSFRIQLSKFKKKSQNQNLNKKNIPN